MKAAVLPPFPDGLSCWDNKMSKLCAAFGCPLGPVVCLSRAMGLGRQLSDGSYVELLMGSGEECLRYEGGEVVDVARVRLVCLGGAVRIVRVHGSVALLRCGQHAWVHGDPCVCMGPC